MGAKFTQGPWKISAHCSTLIFNQSGRNIASSGGYQSNTEDTLDENEANANLIAAAPELLEALENIENDDGRIPKTIWDMRNAAIAKAKGE